MRDNLSPLLLLHQSPISVFSCTFQAFMTCSFLSVILNVSSLSKEGVCVFIRHDQMQMLERCEVNRAYWGTTEASKCGWMCLQGTITQDEGRYSVRALGSLFSALGGGSSADSVRSVSSEWLGWDLLSHSEFFICGYNFNNTLESKQIRKNKNILGTLVVTPTGRSKFVTHLPCKYIMSWRWK